jgi:glycosyltransferase involved in cell wall biosynthesis
MDADLKVSIIIPRLPNRRNDYFKQTIENIESQSYRNFELIVIEKQQSEFQNVNEGLTKVTGDVVHIHHDDDWFTPDAVLNAVNSMRDYDFIHGCAHEIGGSDYIPIIKEPTLKDLISANTIHTATVFYRADLFKKVGTYEQDWLFHLKCLEKGMKIGFCPLFLKNYRIHDGMGALSNEWLNVVRPELDKIVKQRYENCNIR